MTIHTEEKLSKIRSSFCSQCIMRCKMSFVSVAILAQTMTVCEFDLFLTGEYHIVFSAEYIQDNSGCYANQGVSRESVGSIPSFLP